MIEIADDDLAERCFRVTKCDERAAIDQVWPLASNATPARAAKEIDKRSPASPFGR
jgi:hypothetical protein